MAECKTVIRQFNKNSRNEYISAVSTSDFPDELKYLQNRNFQYDRNIFLLYIEYDKKVLMFNKHCTEPVGYCIAMNSEKFSQNRVNYSERLLQIPDDVLKEYPIVISDCFVCAKHRNKGYGKKLTEFVLRQYKGYRISLKAEGESAGFWNKSDFRSLPQKKEIFVIDN